MQYHTKSHALAKARGERIMRLCNTIQPRGSQYLPLTGWKRSRQWRRVLDICRRMTNADRG